MKETKRRNKTIMRANSLKYCRHIEKYRKGKGRKPLPSLEFTLTDYGEDIVRCDKCSKLFNLATFK